MDQKNANLLLARLPADELASVMALVEPVDLVFKQPIYAPGHSLAHVHFVTAGVVSLVATASDTFVEVATVGKEGMVGLPLFLGTSHTTLTAFVQIPGQAWRLASHHFTQCLQSHRQLRVLLQLYTQGLINQIAQSASCNRIHSLPQRCARWMLITRDRVDSDTFPLTQEFLGQMLGVTPPSVIEACEAFQADGSIRFSPFDVTMLDRDRLEQSSCECYRVVQNEYARLLGEVTL